MKDFLKNKATMFAAGVIAFVGSSCSVNKNIASTEEQPWSIAVPVRQTEHVDNTAEISAKGSTLTCECGASYGTFEDGKTLMLDDQEDLTNLVQDVCNDSKKIASYFQFVVK